MWELCENTLFYLARDKSSHLAMILNQRSMTEPSANGNHEIICCPNVNLQCESHLGNGEERLKGE